MMVCGLTTGRRCRSSSTRPPSTCPTRGRSACSRFLLATHSRYSPGLWHTTTPGYAIPSCTTDPSTRTPSVSASPRAGGRSTAGRVSTAARAGWRCCSGLRRDEKPPTAPHRLISFRTFLLETELLAFIVCNRWRHNSSGCGGTQ